MRGSTAATRPADTALPTPRADGIFGAMNVIVVAHDPRWARDFEREAEAIHAALDIPPIALHHIGSTAITGILAKPVVDLLGVVADLDGIDRRAATMRGLDYEVMGPYGIDGRRYFRKSGADGRRTHHLHVFAAGSPQIERHLAFRDYLREHPSKAAEYSALKARLTAGGGASMDAYIEGKAPFIAATDALALDWYRGRDSGSSARTSRG